MKGQVYKFNGLFGFAIGEDSKTYFVHESEIQCDDSHKRAARNQLSKARKDKPVSIEFIASDSENGGNHPRAKQIVIKKAPGWRPQHTLDGFWLSTGLDRGDFRCSSCGATNDYQTKFCPHCGVPMTRVSDEDGYRR